MKSNITFYSKGGKKVPTMSKGNNSNSNDGTNGSGLKSGLFKPNFIKYEWGMNEHFYDRIFTYLITMIFHISLWIYLCIFYNMNKVLNIWLLIIPGNNVYRFSIESQW